MTTRTRSRTPGRRTLEVVGNALAQEVPPPGVRSARIVQLVLDEHPRMAGYRVFLCGNPQLVRVLRKQAYLAGAALAQIHSDPFLSNDRRPS